MDSVPAPVEKPFGLRRIVLDAFAWMALFLVVAGIGWASLFQYLEHRQKQVEQQAMAKTEENARSYASYLQQTLSAIDQLILSIKYGWERSEGKLHLEEMLQTGVFIGASDFYVGIFDKNGNLLTNTVPGSNPINAADAPFFLQQREAAADYLYIDKPALGTFTRRSVIRFSRKLLNHAGQFGGVVLVSVTVKYLTANYESLTLGRHGFLGIVGEDGIVRATRVGDTIQTSDAPALFSVPGFATATGVGIWSGKGRFADGRARYVGWESLSNYPLIALAGMDRQDVLAVYADDRSRLIRNALLATAALALFTLVACSLWIRLAWRKHMHEQTQTTYRLATESGTEGFYIIEPIQEEGAIVDVEFVDCNRRGAQFLGSTRGKVIGHRMSEFYGGRIPRQIMHLLTLSMERGEYEDEIKMAENGPIDIEWMHFKLVRSDGRLAMTLRDISGTKAHVRELERRSNEDTLTGLPNRRWVGNYLPRAVFEAGERHAMLAILFIDLDGFKKVNDTVGHDVGDELLRNAAMRLKVAVRPGDHVVRMGGDEFLVIIEDIHHQSDAAHVARRILHAFEEAFKLSKGMHTIGASIGISMYPADGADAATLIKNADIAMYAVKTGGKRNFRFYDQRFDEALSRRHQRESELRNALEHDQFVMYYQPRIEMASGATSGMEALVRWAHPTRGIVAPNEFIPLAEESGLIVELGGMVVDKVCAQIAAWMRQGQPLVPVSVNVSARQLDETDIEQLLCANISRHGIDPRLVELEVTESAMSRSGGDVARTLGNIQNMGIKLLIDDFGTGYSSLSQLQQLDFDVLKVDRAFTARLEKSTEGTALVRAIIMMAHELGMRVVAEGVETLEQLGTLKALACDEIQGFLISKPVPASEKQPILQPVLPERLLRSRL